MPDVEKTPFRDLVKRIRAGDPAAAEELVRRYEPEVRREVRLRLKGPGLRRLLDSMDISQSVLSNFFLRAAIGEFVLDHPTQLLRLLITMAKNRVTYWARRLQAEKRDKRKDRALDAIPPDSPHFHAGGPSPSAHASAAELLEQFEARMSEDERRIADLRRTGRSWQQVADEMGERSDAVRKRLERARRRICDQLGLDEP